MNELDRTCAEAVSHIQELDARIAAQEARLADRPDPPAPECAKSPTGKHVWGTAYKSSSGRQVCDHCYFVTDAPFEALKAGER